MNILAIIPARGGSKGIPNKNKMSIAGKPLISWTIESAKKSKILNKIIVSSDDPDIISIAEKYNIGTIKRPKKYATDNSSVTSVVVHVLEYLKNKEKYVPDIIVILQPTSPLRTAGDIDGAIKILIQKKAEALISVTEEDNKILKSFFMEKGVLEGIVDDEFTFTRRQDLPKIYMPNGALFIIREKEFRKKKRLFTKKTIGFVMSKDRSIDLDATEELPLLENAILNKDNFS